MRWPSIRCCPLCRKWPKRLGIAGANERQWIITAYLLGFGSAQIVYGTLADRFGRRPILLFGLVVYVWPASRLRFRAPSQP